jgi:AAA family ATP:ADP antiporter
MVVAAAVIGACLVLYNTIDRLHRRRGHAARAGAPPDEGEAPLGKEGGFKLVISERYLLLMALMMLVANLVNTTGEYILTATVEQYAIAEVPDDAFAELGDQAARAAAIKDARRAVGTEFYGDFYGLVNLVGFLLQSFAVSRIFKYLGVRIALFFLPVIAFGGYLAIGLVGGLAVLRVSKTAENSVDYSLQNTVRQALFLPTSREAKYKAKAAIDTFFVRFGDAVSALLVAAGVRGLAMGTRGFALANVALVAVWLVIAAGIARRHKQLSPDG